MWHHSGHSLGDRFDPGKESHYLQYLNAKNMYGWVTSQSLLTDEVRWMESPEKLCISKLAKKQSKGYLLEVDVSYPNDLLDLHNDLPFMYEKMKIHGVQRLVPNLFHKKKYVIYILALDQVPKHGLILKRIHQVTEFDQSIQLLLYIILNTQLRTRVKNNFEKDFFKLMNNAVLGKTMENIRMHRDIKLMMNEKAYLKKVMKLNFKSRSGIKFSNNLMGKIQVLMNKPIYLRQAILDLSKIIMHEFHYDYMKLKNGEKLRRKSHGHGSRVIMYARNNRRDFVRSF